MFSGKAVRALLVLMFLFSFLSAQDTCLTSAEKFFEIGNFDQAITEFKRYIFHNPNSKLFSDVYYKMGLAFRNQGKWSEAINAMEKSITYSFQDSIRDDRRISMAVIRISQAEFNSAEFELLRIASFSKFSNQRQKANFFLGLCCSYSAKWKDAHRYLFQCFSAYPHIQSQLDSLLKLSSNLKYDSPLLAKWLSTFLPGAGQIYCGEVGMGINALLINSITSYLFIDSCIGNRYQDVLLFNFPFFVRYYQGNRHHAEHAAIANNDSLNKSHIKKILNYLVSIPLENYIPALN